MAKILVVEDDEGISESVVEKFTALKHAVDAAFDGGAAMGFIDTYPYDLVLLDVNLPPPDGLELLRYLKANKPNVKVLMMTSKGEIEDKLVGFAAGADDYLPKPFDMRELVARANALLSRPAAVINDKVTVGCLTLDKSSFEVRKSERVVRLQPKDFLLLEFLMRSPDEVFAPDALLDRLWGADSNASVDGLRVAVSRIRKALDPPNCAVSIVESINRVGYRLGKNADALNL